MTGVDPASLAALLAAQIAPALPLDPSLGSLQAPPGMTSFLSADEGKDAAPAEEDYRSIGVTDKEALEVLASDNTPLSAVRELYSVHAHPKTIAYLARYGVDSSDPVRIKLASDLVGKGVRPDRASMVSLGDLAKPITAPGSYIDAFIDAGVLSVSRIERRYLSGLAQDDIPGPREVTISPTEIEQERFIGIKDPAEAYQRKSVSLAPARRMERGRAQAPAAPANEYAYKLELERPE